jgi:hypothetical protein
MFSNDAMNIKSGYLQLIAIRDEKLILLNQPDYLGTSYQVIECPVSKVRALDF